MFDIVRDRQFLQQPSEKFDFSNPQVELIPFVRRMFDTMLESKGIGLAAPQVGQLLQIFVLDPQIVCINPRIVNRSEGRNVMEEGCLSFPGLAVKVKRSESIRIRYQDINGETKTSEWFGMTARAAQHEFDHLQGILFFNRASYYHRQKAFRKWENLRAA